MPPFDSAGNLYYRIGNTQFLLNGNSNDCWLEYMPHISLFSGSHRWRWWQRKRWVTIPKSTKHQTRIHKNKKQKTEKRQCNGIPIAPSPSTWHKKIPACTKRPNWKKPSSAKCKCYIIELVCHDPLACNASRQFDLPLVLPKPGMLKLCATTKFVSHPQWESRDGECVATVRPCVSYN